MNRRGVNYDVGTDYSAGFNSRPVLDHEIVRRELAIIQHDLHCNAVRISGTDPDRLRVAAELALSQGLEVWLSPLLLDHDAEETLVHIVECARIAESLRERWTRVIFIVGGEFTFFLPGILPGKDFSERTRQMWKLWWNIGVRRIHNRPLNAFLARVEAAVRRVFHGEVTYAALPFEAVDWNRFDIVCLDYYRARHNRRTYGAGLARHFAHGKAVVIAELGLCAYRGAELKGATGFMITDPDDRSRLKGPYVRDESLQARELVDMLGLLDRAGVEGAFVFTFVSPRHTHSDQSLRDLDLASFALVKSFADSGGTTYPGMPWEPKEAFGAVAEFYGRDAARAAAAAIFQ